MNENSFLPPIEKPKSLRMKIAYAIAKSRFGKVLSPLKVAYSRLPLGFALFSSKIGTLDRKLSLSRELQLLIRERVARINVCLFCMDIGRYFAVKAHLDQAKFDALENYNTSSLFSQKERVALDYVSELTKNKQMTRELFDRLANHFSEREICEIVWLVATEHVYNMTNIGLNIHSDLLCDLALKGQATHHT